MTFLFLNQVFLDDEPVSVELLHIIRTNKNDADQENLNHLRLHPF